MTYGPSGTCNGQPCFTSTDISQYENAIANLNAEKDDLEAQIEVINNDLATLEHEYGDAVRNACPA